MHCARVLVCALSGLVLTPFVTGCSNTEFRVGKVSGTVTLNGEPLPEATVLFSPQGKDPGPASSATTDDSGAFSLAFADGKEGAVVGKHRVTISTRQFAPRKDNSDAEEEIAPEKVPDSYLTEPFLTFDVPSGGTTDATFDLKGPPPKKKSGGPQRPSND